MEPWDGVHIDQSPFTPHNEQVVFETLKKLDKEYGDYIESIGGGGFDMKPLEILDCFAGIGGFSVAAERLVGGFKTTQFIEIDPYCQKVLNKHFKGVPIHDDIRTFSAPEGAYQVLTGGFPCQDVSVAGKQRGIGEGTRSGLFYEILRLSREIRPEFLLLENVRNLLSHEGGKTFQEVLYQIAKTGVFKCIEWGVVSAKDVGASHKRERIWILAHSKPANTNGKRSQGLRRENMNYKKAAEKKRLAGVLNHTHSNLTGENTQLNPAFLEAMMGFDIGWTELDA